MKSRTAGQQAKMEGNYPKANRTVARVLSAVVAHLQGISSSCESQRDNMPDNLQFCSVFDELADLAGEILVKKPHFLRGSRPQRIASLITIMEAVAAALAARSSDCAAQLRALSVELEGLNHALD